MPTYKEELIRRGIPLHEIQHHQHRRADWQDYADRGLYMVTLCVEGRYPYFGHLEGDIRAPRSAADFPHIVLSPLGRSILEVELPKIHQFYPEIEVWQASIMPDHLHLLLYVSATLPKEKKLGDILRSFKGGCSRAWWAEGERCGGRTITALKSAGTAAEERSGMAEERSEMAEAGNEVAKAGSEMPEERSGMPEERSEVAKAGSGVAEEKSGMPEAENEMAKAGNEVAGNEVGGSGMAGVPVLSSAVQRPALFEAGYHDRIIKRPGMLDNIKRYMSDNPLRALMRRQLPHLMERRLHLRVGAHDYAAFGALFLIKRAEKEQVFYHRRDDMTGMPTVETEKYRQERERQLAEARGGVVLVSPSVSEGERRVIDTAIDEGLPVIHLQKEPITRYWKPERRRFEACARGALLILAPWGLDEEIRITALKSAGTAATAGWEEKAGMGMAAPVSDYARFHHLNDLAAEICATTDAVLMNVSEIR